MGPRTKPMEQLEYPSGWVYVNTSEQAHNYLRGLWDSFLDAHRIAFPLTENQWNKIADQSFAIPKKYTMDVLTVLNRFLPEETRKIIEKYPPYFIVMPDAYFEVRGTKSVAFWGNTSGSVVGAVMRDEKSNVIFVSQGEYAKLNSVKGLVPLLIHESLHYAKALTNKKWRESIKHGFDEGVTEYLSLRFSIEVGYKHPNSSEQYRFQFRVAHVLGKLVRDDEFVSAYFSSDYSEIRKKVDKLCGFGTWDRLYDSLSDKFHISDPQKVMDILKDIIKKAKLNLDQLNRELDAFGKLTPKKVQ
ncbi:MAG: hypothetical protein ABII22_06615 [Candidatus Micrarchaeota archaeon]